jgi:ribonuclease P protein component
MLRKTRRLRSAEVREIIARGKGARHGAISLKYLDNKGFFRAAAVVSKATAKRAVERNRLRRTLYRVLATLAPQEVQKLDGKMLVFFVRSSPSPLLSGLREDIRGILTKLA